MRDENFHCFRRPALGHGGECCTCHHSGMSVNRRAAGSTDASAGARCKHAAGTNVPRLSGSTTGADLFAGFAFLTPSPIPIAMRCRSAVAVTGRFATPRFMTFKQAKHWAGTQERRARVQSQIRVWYFIIRLSLVTIVDGPPRGPLPWMERKLLHAADTRRNRWV